MESEVRSSGNDPDRNSVIGDRKRGIYMGSIKSSGRIGIDPALTSRIFAIAGQLNNTSGNWRAWAVVSMLALTVFAWMTFIDGRPFWVMTTDPEPDYYYNSLTILETGIPASVRHPGTPAYYIGGALLAINGTDPSDLQRFFNLTYLVAILVFVFSMALFTRIALAGVSFAPSLLILSSLLLWPPFLTYSNYFSVESFVFSVSVMASAFVYPVLSSKPGVMTRSMLAFAILVGMGTALKFTFLPIGISVGFMMAVVILWSNHVPSLKRKLLLIVRNGTALALVMVVSFLIFVLPVVPYLYEFIGRLYIEVSKSSRVESIFVEIGRFFRLAPEFGILILFVLIGFGVLLGVRKYTRVDGAVLGVNIPQISVIPPTIALLLALLLFSLSLLGTIPDLTSAEHVDPGHFLRQITPIAGFLPLLLLITWKTYVAVWPGLGNSIFRQRSHGVILIAISALLIIPSVGGYFSWRSETFHEIKRSVAHHQDALRMIAPSGERVAIFDWGGSFGEPMFFFWGNYRYGIDRFDEELLHRFPRHTILRVREINGLASQLRGDDGAKSNDSATAQSQGILRGPIQEIYDSIIFRWKQRFPRRSRTHELITGEDSSHVISMLMYRPDRLTSGSPDAGDTESDLRNLLEDRFGKIGVSQIKIEDEIWSVIELNDR